jgi:hypothetical protein
MMLACRDVVACEPSNTWKGNGTALMDLHRQKTDDVQTRRPEAEGATQRRLAVPGITAGPGLIGLTKGDKVAVKSVQR